MPGVPLGSRYCETDRLADVAWGLFGNWPPEPARPGHLRLRPSPHVFGYEHARPTKTAWDAFDEGGRLPRLAHLAITFCRCMNIRRATAPVPRRHRRATALRPDGFCRLVRRLPRRAWYTFDPRNNVPRIGRMLMARGRDAADVAITTTFGPTVLAAFKMWTDEIARPLIEEHFRRFRGDGRGRVRSSGRRSRARFSVRHLTVYRSSAPVELGERRMILSRHTSHDLRIVKLQAGDPATRPRTCAGSTTSSTDSVAMAAFHRDDAPATHRQPPRRSSTSKVHSPWLPPRGRRRSDIPFQYTDDEQPSLCRRADPSASGRGDSSMSAADRCRRPGWMPGAKTLLKTR